MYDQEEYFSNNIQKDSYEACSESSEKGMFECTLRSSIYLEDTGDSFQAYKGK